MSLNIIKSTEFNVADVSFIMNVDKTTKRKIFFVNHNKKPIYLKTPKMYFPSGLKHWKSDAYPESFELEVSFGEDKSDPANNAKIQDFYEKMKQLDSLIKQQILDNPMEWIGKKKTSMEMIEESYYPKPIVKVPHDKEGNVLEYAPKMRLKVERERNGETFTGKFSSSNRDKTQVLMFDENGTDLELTEENCESVVPKGTKGTLLAQLVNINVVGDKVYPKWKLVQGKISKNTSGRIDRNIMDDDEESEVLEDLDSETPEKHIEQLEEDLDDLEVEEVEEVEEVVEEEEQEVVDDLEQVQATPVKKPRAKRGVVA
jgi:hypothetical protein